MFWVLTGYPMIISSILLIAINIGCQTEGFRGIGQFEERSATNTLRLEGITKE